MYNVDEKVKEVKAILFDIISENEGIKNRIEQQVVAETDEKRVEKLRNLWEKYNSYEKACIASTNSFINCVRAMDACAKDYMVFNGKNRARKQQGNMQNAMKNSAPENKLSEEKVVDEKAAVGISPEVVDAKKLSEDVPVQSVEAVSEAPAQPVGAVSEAPAQPVEAVSEAPAQPVEAVSEAPAQPVEAVSEAPAQPVEAVSETPAQPVEAVSEAPAQPVEAVSEAPAQPVEAVSEAPAQPVEAVSEAPAQPVEAVSETPVQPVEAVSETPAQPVEAVSETPAQPVEAVSEIPAQPVEAVSEIPAQPVEAVDPNLPNLPDIPDELESTVSKETIKPEVQEVKTVENVASNMKIDSTPLIPTVDAASVANPSTSEEKNVDVKIPETIAVAPLIPTIPEENSQQAKTDTNSLISLPSLDDGNSSVLEKVTFVKKSANADKALLINKSQAEKLRASKINNKELFNSLPTDENVSESQLEEMLNQVSALYKEGKQEEAAKLSDKISVLSKKMRVA